MPESWGRYPKEKQVIQEMSWRTSPLPKERPLLAYGLGKSYGDACLNEDGILISTRRLNHIIEFDKEKGVITCEAGVTLAEVLKLVIPHGWFLEVTPGHKYITVGGAIANEVHGKNHHRAGTFCHHLLKFELLHSDDSRLICSPTENTELFKATCGGIGLTGLITWAQFKLKPITSVYLEAESIKTSNLQEALGLFAQSKDTHEYVIASVSTNHSGQNIGAGYFLRGNHKQSSPANTKQDSFRPTRLTLPVPMPISFVNPLTARVFNTLYFNKQRTKQVANDMHYEPFFYPQDAIGQWNYLYGPTGFLQYQCQIPSENAQTVLQEIFQTVRAAGYISPLTTLKLLGEKPSVGYLAFPRAGYTLAMDFPNTGKSLLEFFEKLDAMVTSAKGRIYLAKDARMPASMFHKSYPDWQTFSQSIDPAFSSSMWKRISKRKQPMHRA